MKWNVLQRFAVNACKSDPKKAAQYATAEPRADEIDDAGRRIVTLDGDLAARLLDADEEGVVRVRRLAGGGERVEQVIAQDLPRAVGNDRHSYRRQLIDHRAIAGAAVDRFEAATRERHESRG